MKNKSPIRNTIEWLKLCRKARAKGYPVSYTTDPTWLVNQAINRRAGWFDDPSEYRGSCMPVPVRQDTRLGVIVVRNGKYPRRASGSAYQHLRNLAYALNQHRRIVRETELGEWRKLLLGRIPERITRIGDEY